MADYGALVRGFQEGANFAQDFRAKRQFERRREQELSQMDRELAATAGAEQDLMAQFPDETKGMSAFEFEPTFDEPMAFKLFNKLFKKGKKKKTQALDLGGDSEFASSNPGPAAPEEDFDSPEALGYADGGVPGDGSGRLFVEDLEELDKKQQRNARVEIAKERVKQGARKVGGAVRKAIPDKDGLLRRTLNSKAGRVGGALAVGSALVDQMDENADERFAKRFGWEGPTEDEGDASFAGFMKYFAKRGLGFASDLGDKVTFGLASKMYRDGEEDPAAAPKRRALPVAAEGTPGNPMQLSTTTIRASGAQPGGAGRSQEPSFDFSDIEPADVPDMKTDEWRQYRQMIIRDAARRGQPIDQVNDRITAMQQKNFQNYGQQGLALQQAGNLRGAMAAYRAAFQYFPNGNDVEFGVNRNKRTGQQQIVGFGRDEKTGKRVPGTELIMDPERVAVLLENFKNPQAFRMWTKDWRDFQQNMREYEEGKPVKQAMASAALTNAQANLEQSRNYALRYSGQGGMKQSDVRAAQEMFAGMLMEQGVSDPNTALQLADIAIQLKQRQPQLSETTIIKMMKDRGAF